MTLTVTLLVLCAALLHASWNAVVRANADRLLMMGYISAGSALAVVPFLPFVPFPDAQVWPILLLSLALHTGYMLVLATAYEHGALGHVYPLARGTAPLLVTGAGILLLGETLAPYTMLSILLIAGGILSLIWRRDGAEKATREAIVYSLITSVFIAAYTVNDGIGGRTASTPFIYTVWLMALDGAVFVPIVLWRRGAQTFFRLNRAARQGLFGGAVATVGYAIVIWAMSVAPLGPVSALRESSVVFAALISAVFLKERLGAAAIAAALMVTAGIILLRL